MDFGNYIKKLRDEQGLSGREVARRANVSQAYLSQLERGENKKPSPEIIGKLAKVLNVPTTTLMVTAGYWGEDDLLEPIEETLNNLKKNNSKEETNQHITDLKIILERHNLIYNNHPITDKEKQLIKSYLDALFSDK